MCRTSGEILARGVSPGRHRAPAARLGRAEPAAHLAFRARGDRRLPGGRRRRSDRSGDRDLQPARVGHDVGRRDGRAARSGRQLAMPPHRAGLRAADRGRPCGPRTDAHRSADRPDVPRPQDEMAARPRAAWPRGATRHDRCLADPLPHGGGGPCLRRRQCRPQPALRSQPAGAGATNSATSSASPKSALPRGSRQRLALRRDKERARVCPTASPSPRPSATAMPRCSVTAPSTPATAR